MRFLLILMLGMIVAVSSNNVPILRLNEALAQVADLTRQLNGIKDILEDTPVSSTQQCPNYPSVDVSQVAEVTGLVVLRRAASKDGLVSLSTAASSALCLGRCLGSITNCRFAVYNSKTKACQGVTTLEPYIMAGASSQFSILALTAKQFHRLESSKMYGSDIYLANPVKKVGTEEKCRNLCAIHPVCLGAMFDSSTGHCHLMRTFDGALTSSFYSNYVTFVQINVV
ncbi:hypothetical protein BV898_08597 [Hypsibius exemplaris]|uniref:Apple domain-containing protein n=1 Tax=Hypsibius exemplaris TaxID=2072580 RepID=A0A1W0WQ69_HYPEX|nr:hypothetical protein BV898_08597 [Hypsibius exemplaris]